jgi:biopolymer transport protein TolR
LREGAAMAQVEESGRGRASTVDVNIVPFIDLMSVLVIFLLITAVWSQVSIIQLGSSIYGKKSQDVAAEPPKVAEIPFRVDVKPNGYKIVIGRQDIVIPKLNKEEYDLPRLMKELKTVKSLYPEKEDATITMDDEIEYVHLVDTMDAILQAKFPQVSVSTAGGAL